MTEDERKEELEQLKRMLAASTGREGYKQRIEAIQKRINELKNGTD